MGFDPGEHPRDKDGKFVDADKNVKPTTGNNGTLPFEDETTIWDNNPHIEADDVGQAANLREQDANYTFYELEGHDSAVLF